MIFDPRYFVVLAPAQLLSLWGSWRTGSAFNRHSRAATLSGLSGAEAARRVLEAAGLRRA